MKLEKVKKQLLREMKANPKKGIALGLLCLVAVWFWGPLVVGWVSKSKGKKTVAKKAAKDPDAGESKAAKPTSGNSSAAEKKESEKVTAAPALGWSTLLEMMKSDPSMAPAGHLSLGRDPFVSVQPVVANAIPKDEEETEGGGTTETKQVVTHYVATPESLGLLLSATVVGGTRSTAMINGRAYPVGRRIVVKSGEARYIYRLLEVHAGHVVLHDGQNHYELSIPEPADEDEVLLASGNQTPEGEIKINATSSETPPEEQ